MDTRNRKTAYMGMLGIMLLGLLFAVAPSQDVYAASKGKGKHGHAKHKKHKHHHHHHHWYRHHKYHHSSLGLRIGATSSTYWVPGRYEYRTEQVLVQAAHYTQVWVGPEYKEITQDDGTILKIKIRDGYMKQVYVPARYETVTTRVWVPGYYASTPSQPSINFGIGFRF